MSKILASRRKPEEEELDRKRVELAGLQSELADSELEITCLRTELAAFQALYMRIVGVHYTELDVIEAEIAEGISRSRPSDEGARDNASQARTKAAASMSDYEEALASKSLEFIPSQALRSLYREVAKRVHPDLATDPADRSRRQRFMADANRAYEMGDENRLKAILEEYEDSPESVSGEGPAAELVRVIRKIAQVKRRLNEIETESGQTTRSDLFILREKMLAAEKQGKDLLQEMAEAVKQQVDTARQRLENLPQGE
jgi:hypothetical protein